MVRVEQVEIGPGVTISAGNVFKDLRRVSLGKNAVMGGWNLISAAPVFSEHLEAAGELRIDESAGITSRHSVDCSGPVHLEPFSLLAGHGTQVLTHSIDLGRNVQSAHPIVIGERSFVGSRCVVLGGASVPSKSVVAAGSVVTSAALDEASLIAGVPARSRRPIEGAWFERETEKTNTVYDSRTGNLTFDAF